MGERMIYWMWPIATTGNMLFSVINVAGAEMDASNGLRVKNPTHISFQIYKRPHWDKISLKIFGDD